MFLRNDPSFAKHGAFQAKWKSVVHTVLVATPMKLLFAILEYFWASKPKNTVLFIFPYREYCENTRYLLRAAVRRRDPDMFPVAFVYDKELYDEIKIEFPHNVVYARTFHALQHFSRSNTVVLSRGMLIKTFYPFYFVSNRKTLINLWHGIPLKRMGIQTAQTWEGRMGPETQNFDFWICCSKIEQLCLACCFALNISNVCIIGTPRNDILFQSRYRQQSSRGHRRRILYAPTWRDGLANVRLFPFDDVNLPALDNFLAQHDMVMSVRLHPNERAVALKSFETFEQITIDDGTSHTSVQEDLLDTDILITDYSSIYLDYLILDRPIIFIPYDRKEYEEKRGFFFDYDAVTPGPKIRSQAELLECIAEANQGYDPNRCLRGSVFRQFHEVIHGDSTILLLECIRNMLKYHPVERRKLSFSDFVNPPKFNDINCLQGAGHEVRTAKHQKPSC